MEARDRYGYKLYPDRRWDIWNEKGVVFCSVCMTSPRTNTIDTCLYCRRYHHQHCPCRSCEEELHGGP